MLTLDRKGVAQMRTLAETDVDAEEMDIIEAGSRAASIRRTPM